MDLGIAGRKAIVCASSRGLGRGCAEALAAAGCEVVVNGRDAAQLERTAAGIRAATGATVLAVVADVATHEGQDSSSPPARRRTSSSTTMPARRSATFPRSTATA